MLEDEITPDKCILCAVSGGSDSDVLIDILSNKEYFNSIKFVYIDTGLEFKCTEEHLKYLEGRYKINIIRYKPNINVADAIKLYGQPFLNKYVSEMIGRLQDNYFEFIDAPFEELILYYPNCISALKWWCGKHPNMYSIKANKYLKEFMIENPPDFKISNQCSIIGKKYAIKNLIKEYNANVNIFGVRAFEGGTRKNSYKESCFKTNNLITYLPLLNMSNQEKENYIKEHNIIHSNAYEVYGLTRTGCVGCPCARDKETEIRRLRYYEPETIELINNVFGDTIEYTKNI